MTVTISLNANENRYGTSRFWEAFGTTVTSGTLQTARWSWWLYRDGTLVDQNHTGPCFQHTFDDADNGVSFDLYLHVLEEGAGSATEEHLTWTQTVDSWDRTYYVSTGGSDSNNGLSTGAAKATVASAFSDAKDWWILEGAERSVRILLNGGQTHNVSGRQHYAGDGSVQGRWGLGAYGTGRPTMNITTDSDILSIGQGFNDRHSTLDCRGIDVTGASGNEPFVTLNVNASATSPAPSFSLVLSDVTIDNQGGITGTAIDNGPLSVANATDGRCDHLAFTDVTLTDSVEYGIYSGNSHLPKYISLDYCTWGNLTGSGDGTAIRAYGWQYLFFRAGLVYNHDSDALRLLSAGSDTTVHARYWNLNGIGTYDGQYTFHNTDAEGGTALEENRFQDHWYHGIRCNSDDAAGAGIVLGGYRQRISVRASWFRGTTIDLSETDTNNDTNQYLHVECNTWYYSTAAGGDGLGVRSSHTSGGTLDHWYVQNNFGVCAAQTGTPNFFASSGSGIANSTLSASNYNVWIIPGGGALNWYGGMTSGGVSLSSWQGSTVYDDNSSAASGTHGLTATGTAGTADDYDFSISTSSAAYNTGVEVPGAQIDKRGYLRVATHDAGASDQAASGPPTEPGGGGGGGGSTQSKQPSRLGLQMTLGL